MCMQILKRENNLASSALCIMSRTVHGLEVCGKSVPPITWDERNRVRRIVRRSCSPQTMSFNNLIPVSAGTAYFSINAALFDLYVARLTFVMVLEILW